MKMTRRTTTRKAKKNGRRPVVTTKSLAANEYGDDRTTAKTATQGPALNEKLRYCWLNSDKMDSSDENGMAIKIAARIKNGGE